MAFDVNYDEASSGSDLLPKGEYEVIIKYAGEDAIETTGTVYIGVTCVVRNDVDQQYKNKYIWHNIWHKREPSKADLSYGGYSSKQINSLSKAVRLPNGQKFESLADWCEALKDRCMRVTIEHEEYNGKTNARVKWTNETKFPDCKHVWKPKESDTANNDAPESNNSDFVEISGDDDLPF